MRIHLIRHAHTEALGHTLSGRSEISLSEQGKAEAQRLAATFAGKPITAVLSSPRTRARQTAAAITQDVRTEDALDEIDFGSWTGASFQALAEQPDWQRWNTHRSLAATPAGDTMLHVQARAVELLERLHAAGDKAFILVSHADVIKAVLTHLLGMPLDLMARIEIAPASCSTVEISAGNVLVKSINAKEGLLF